MEGLVRKCMLLICNDENVLKPNHFFSVIQFRCLPNLKQYKVWAVLSFLDTRAKCECPFNHNVVSLSCQGKPSAGKSTFFNAATTLDLAKTGAHPFTTIKPNIGKAFFSIPCPCSSHMNRCNAGTVHAFLNVFLEKGFMV